MGYLAFEVDKKSRKDLKKIFEPQFKEFIGHHVTYKFGVKSNEKLPNKPKIAKVVGYVKNDKGLEALVVEINGSTKRPDGKTFHITWSLDRSAGFKPVHSNNLLTSGKWENVNPIEIKLNPKFFK